MNSNKCPECGKELEMMPDGEEVCKECGYYRFESEESYYKDLLDSITDK